MYYSRVKLSYSGLSGQFGGCSGAVGVCRGMFGAPTGLFRGLLSSSGNSWSPGGSFDHLIKAFGIYSVKILFLNGVIYGPVTLKIR